MQLMLEGAGANANNKNKRKRITKPTGNTPQGPGQREQPRARG